MSGLQLQSYYVDLLDASILAGMPKNTNRKRIAMKNQSELFFAKELWKLLLEIEDYVRDHYRNLVDQEIYDLHDENNSTDQF